MYSLILGIDPGAQGAVAFMLGGKPGAIELLQTIDHGWIRDNIIPGSTLAVLEKAQAMPGQGVVSMFTYGQNFGRIIGWLEALGIPHVLVPPKAWQKEVHVGCYGSDAKAKTLQAVQRLYPNLDLKATPRSKKPHLGIVDAVAIARYGALKYGRNYV